MLFLWTTTELGKVWIDGESLRQIIAKRIPAGYYCQEVSFIGAENLLNIYIAVSDDGDTDKKRELEEKFRELFAKSGILAKVSWLYVAPQDNPKTTPIWHLPLFWAGAAALCTAIVHMGFSGVLWSVFAAVIGYGVSWVVLTEDGQKQVNALIEHFRR